MILQIVEFASLLLGVAYLLYFYSDKQVKMYIKVLAFIAWLLSFGFVFILPLDIYWTLENQRKIDDCPIGNKLLECADFDGTSIPQFKTMIQVWRTVYWITFIFTWLVLPFFQDYEAAGEFDLKGKVMHSIKINLAIIGGVGAVGVLFIVYLLIKGSISWDNLEGFLTGLANGFGIFLVVILLGHGLVKIPKKCWRERNEEIFLKLCYFQAAQVDDSKINTRYVLEEKVKLLLFAKEKHKGLGSDQYFATILEQIPKHILQHCKETKEPSEKTKNDLNDLGNISVPKLVNLNQETKKILAQMRREESRWDALLDEAFFSQDIIENQFSSNNKIQSVFAVPRQGKLGHLIDTVSWVWNCKFKKTVKLLFAFLFGFLSLLVLLGEISIFSGKTMNPFSYVISDTHIIGTQFLVLFPLLYITFCVYYGMFQVKLAGLFGIYKYHQTDAPSLMFFSINFARVSAPISYNFLKIIGVKNSAFVQILGAMDDVPILGSANTYFFPMILIMLILFNTFDIYSKILSALGLKQFEFSDSFDDELIDQGKHLIMKARDQWQRKFEKMRSGSMNIYQGYNTASSLREFEQAENFGRDYSSDDAATDCESRTSSLSSQPSSKPASKQKNGNKFQKFEGFDDILQI